MHFTLTVLRHGSSTKPADKSYEADLARQLTDKGVAQAKARGDMLKQEFDLVIASPTKRCVKTAALVAGIDESEAVTLDELFYDGQSEQSKAIDALFNALGYAPLAYYLMSKGGHHVLAHGENAWQALMVEIETNARAKDTFGSGYAEPKSVLVVGHAVLTPAMVFASIGHPPMSQDENNLVNANLGECEGFSCSVENNKAGYFKMIRDPVEETALL